MRPAEKLSEREYLALEATSDTKHEFVNGEILAMAGASARHNALAMNLASALVTALRNGPCRPLGSDQRVRVDATGLYAYPDLTITCGKLEFAPGVRPSTLLNPTVVIEILSGSTEAWDRGAKSAHYRNLPSLQELVLVSQQTRRVEVYRRRDAGEWSFVEAAGSGTIALEALGITVPLDEIYAGTDELPDDDG
jgi:Uma2 family endonuclease